MKEIILNRRSIRKYSDYKISNTELYEMLDEALRAPSSGNLQPLRFFVIESKAAREKLRPILRMNVSQLETASQLILITGDKHKYQMAETIFSRAVAEGIMPDEVKHRQLDRFKNIHHDPTSQKYISSLFLDAGLFASHFMLVARMHGYDTCPIGGFNTELANETLGIDSNYLPILLISIGKKDEEGYQSIRLKASEITYHID